MKPTGHDDTIKTGQQLAGVASDLLDSEVQQAVKIVVGIQRKYAAFSATPENLDKLRDEALTRLADIGILATLDPTPCFYGEPPVLEIVGKVGDPGFKKPFDHEQKAHEVRKADTRGEDYLGQKERVNTRKPK